MLMAQIYRRRRIDKILLAVAGLCLQPNVMLAYAPTAQPLARAECGSTLEAALEPFPDVAHQTAFGTR